MTQTQTQTLWQEVKTCWRAVVICIFVTIGAFQFGYDSSYYSGKQPQTVGSVVCRHA